MGCCFKFRHRGLDDRELVGGRPFLCVSACAPASEWRARIGAIRSITVAKGDEIRDLLSGVGHGERCDVAQPELGGERAKEGPLLRAGGTVPAAATHGTLSFRLITPRSYRPLDGQQ
jgi:hypothetical protein